MEFMAKTANIDVEVIEDEAPERPLLLRVWLFTIWRSVNNGKEILASIKDRDPGDSDSLGIRVSFSPAPLTCHVALS